MKVSHKASHSQPNLSSNPKVLARPTLVRHHSDHSDHFHRSGYGHSRPQYRRAHSAPRVPMACSKPKVAAPAKDTMAARIGAKVGVRMGSFGNTVLAAVLVFAEYLINVLLDAGAERVGRRFGVDQSARVLRPKFGNTGI